MIDHPVDGEQQLKMESIRQADTCLLATNDGIFSKVPHQIPHEVPPRTTSNLEVLQKF